MTSNQTGGIRQVRLLFVGMLTSDVTFSYKKIMITEGIPVGGGNGNAVPEPSSAALLTFSLVGLLGFSRKRLRS